MPHNEGTAHCNYYGPSETYEEKRQREHRLEFPYSGAFRRPYGMDHLG